MSFLNKSDPSKGIVGKFDRSNRFQIKRNRIAVGLFEYSLENLATHEKLLIPRYLFDRFRSTFVMINQKLEVERLTAQEIDHKMYFKDLECYRFRFSSRTIDQVLVTSYLKGGSLKVSKQAIPALIDLLFHEGLDHPSDTFDAIVDYHRLFQFTFSEGSESITSGLVIRKDVLAETKNYTPEMNPIENPNKIFYPGEEFKNEDLQGILPTGEKIDSKVFKSKLAHRISDKSYSVDYESLFQNQKKSSDPVEEQKTVKPLKYRKDSNSFPLPLMASEVKSAKSDVFKIELMMDDAATFRNDFLTDRSCELYLGFEIIDTVHKVNGKFKSYRFPLYYQRVKLEESGRFLHIQTPKDNDIYLNHLALITLINKFTHEKGDEPLLKFLNHILAQKIEVGKELYPMKIHRQLPISDSVFRQSRDILIGQPGENGKGGLLEGLKVIGIECDLESVMIYKVARSLNPTTLALSQDLQSIQGVAHEEPDRFHSSLLGKFLVPEKKTESKDTKFCEKPMSPGYLPKSMQKLMSTLNTRDLILLEGPPGTGKTFTIMNLFIHCVNTKKKLLIVSDQKAALHALTEKLEEYLVGRDYDTPAGKNILSQWKSAVRVIDEIPSDSDTLFTWVAKLIKMMALDYCRDYTWPEITGSIVEDIDRLDEEFQQAKNKLEDILSIRFARKRDGNEVAPKPYHPTTESDIKDLVDYLSFIGAGEHNKIHQSDAYVNNQVLAQRFIENRENMVKGALASCYKGFRIIISNLERSLDFAESHIELLEKLLNLKPKTIEEFRSCFDKVGQTDISSFLLDHWKSEFVGEQGVVRKISSYIVHPCASTWKKLLVYLRDQKHLLVEVSKMERSEGILRQLQEIHQSLDPSKQGEATSAALEITRLSQDDDKVADSSVQVILNELSFIQRNRDELVKASLLHELSLITKEVIKPQKQGTSMTTTLTNLLESLKESKTIDHGSGVAILKELQEKMVEAFPIWLCRKQTASFLFQSRPDLFDLVIVDEAGQCKVDDAIPLLYRAKKLMVVGDEKQTLLDKNSIVDDYLFSEFELEEQLRTTQARGVKGGGSNLFSLVKSIKQGGVMLDEHYRCPPDIITYSNEYVYNSELKVMQWSHPKQKPSVVVDFSEKDHPASRKPTSGKFKAIEVDMVDRFLEYVATSVKDIEKEIGRKINMETDVALCYFLLKNEPYVKEKKSAFLQSLKRGSDVLDGAGAALQGKERNYIFYLWDVTRGNMMFFKQGDDPDKRKGELNVLMSRPKVRAYHYLHKNFDSLKHDSSSITDYLWKTYQSQHGEEEAEGPKARRTRRPGKDFRPWQRSSGQMMMAILSYLCSARNIDFESLRWGGTHVSVVVGDPARKVDLMILSTPEQATKSLGIVDISAFEQADFPAEDLIDYYFQLKRASPGLEPVFTFLHEIADERSLTYLQIEKKVKQLLRNKVA